MSRMRVFVVIKNLEETFSLISAEEKGEIGSNVWVRVDNKL